LTGQVAAEDAAEDAADVGAVDVGANFKRWWASGAPTDLGGGGKKRRYSKRKKTKKKKTKKKKTRKNNRSKIK